MKAMILAAGRGERMRPLTDATPKPLLVAGGQRLIEYHLATLRTAGVREVIINHAWLGEQIEAALGDGSRYGLTIRYSPEPHGALETAGGIRHALPLLGDAPFWLVNGDVYCPPDWTHELARAPVPDGKQTLAHILLATNPPHHPQGDFGICAEGRATPREASERAYTYTGLGCYHPALFAHLADNQPAPLAPLLFEAIAHNQLAASLYTGDWRDIGTPERLAALDKDLRARASAARVQFSTST
ncbi:MAG: nucleotidyltransferase family protein [Rhodocyclaceae bacterium]|nr:nucleotidyltransferase family protein [Rhodocyclaceae bacterium]